MRGGARKGAGRPTGATTQRSRAIADAASKNGVTPLEVMLKAMREHYKAKRWDDAASVAKDCAPYMHPKLASTQHTGAGGGPIQFDVSRLKGMSTEQLDLLENALVQMGLSAGDSENE